VRPSGRRGTSLVELLVATTLALLVLGALTAAVGAGARILVGGGARGEAEDTVQLALEAFEFDLRRAGWDPTAAGIAALVQATADRLRVVADLDGDGSVDAASEETTEWVCNASTRRLSRIVGRQSLPLADRVAACAFGYVGADGAPVPIPPGGLDAGACAAVRAVAFDLTLMPNGLAGATRRRLLVGLRSAR
jgi:Tfp pilus assembly protein PilW